MAKSPQSTNAKKVESYFLSLMLLLLFLPLIFLSFIT